MDNPWYDYVPFPQRPKLAWPRNARVGWFVLLHLEYWELLPDEKSHKDPRFVGEFGSFVPDYRTWTQRVRQPHRHLPRARRARPLPGARRRGGERAAAERYPYLIEQFKKRKYEFVAHGHSANRMITSKMSEAEEKAEIAEAIAAIEKAAGVRPKGWLGQDYGESQRTPKLLADAGLDYVLDWPNDDQPYPMKVGKPFVSMPNQPEWDDVQQLLLRRINAALSRPGRRGLRIAASGRRPGVQPLGPSLADGRAASHKISRRSAAPHRALRQRLAGDARRDRGALHGHDDG